jgi:hypothetical protein
MSIDVHASLSEQLLGLVPAACLKKSRQRRWASATFTGSRHSFLIGIAQSPPNGFLGALEAHEFAIPHHVVADVSVIARTPGVGDCEIELEALTVEMD